MQPNIYIIIRITAAGVPIAALSEFVCKSIVIFKQIPFCDLHIAGSFPC
jgi:hypothetical protein